MAREWSVVIDSFTGGYAFLSNFYPSAITTRFSFSSAQWVFPTGEHAFQACKIEASGLSRYEKFDFLDRVLSTAGPAHAKRLGREIKIDVGKWNSLSYSYMWFVQETKYKENPDLAERLLATGDAILIEGNAWGDKVWGKVDGVGLNLLGEILMGIRKELR